MEKHGFRPYAGEWWHFSDTQSYAVDKEFEPREPASYYADCQEYISLRTQPSTAGEVIVKIPAGETFTVYAKHGDFAWIEYREVFGYVLMDYIQPLA